jgi:hypothetical protein
MYAISRVYREQEVSAPFPQSRVPFSPSQRVQLRPVPPTPRRAPQPAGVEQNLHPWMCGCDACQPTLPRRQQVSRSTRSEYDRGSAYKPSSSQAVVPEPEQDLCMVLVPTIMRKVRRSIEAHPCLWLALSCVLSCLHLL